MIVLDRNGPIVSWFETMTSWRLPHFLFLKRTKAGMETPHDMIEPKIERPAFDTGTFIKTAAAFNHEFGPGAEPILMTDYFGDASPLAGQIDPFAHRFLMVSAMQMALRQDEIAQTSIQIFFQAAAASRSLNYPVDPTYVNERTVGRIALVTLRDLAINRAFNRQFGAAAQKSFAPLAPAVEGSPLHQQFKPAAMPFMHLAIMSAALKDPVAAKLAVKRLLDTVRLQEAADKARALTGKPRCIIVDPVVVNRRNLLKLAHQVAGDLRPELAA